MSKKLKWAVREGDEYFVVIPTEPGHTDTDDLSCVCKPTIQFGYEDDGQFNELEKPVIYHECFVYMKRVARAMKKLKL